jgi:hypothetical protein
MTELPRQTQTEQGTPVQQPDGGSPEENADRDRTAGKNRDFDATGTSINQGHGHPREERGHTEHGAVEQGDGSPGLPGGDRGQGGAPEK